MKPTIGRVVVYKPTEEDFEKMKKLSNDYFNKQEELPAVIVGVWSDECVNLKVFTDGDCPDLWATSKNIGRDKGNWNWPQIQK